MLQEEARQLKLAKNPNPLNDLVLVPDPDRPWNHEEYDEFMNDLDNPLFIGQDVVPTPATANSSVWNSTPADALASEPQSSSAVDPTSAIAHSSAWNSTPADALASDPQSASIESTTTCPVVISSLPDRESLNLSRSVIDLTSPDPPVVSLATLESVS